MGRITEGQLLLASSLSLERKFVLGNTYLSSQDAAFSGGGFVEGMGSGDADVDIYAIRAFRLTMGQIDSSRFGRVSGRKGELLATADKEAEVRAIQTTIPGTSIRVRVHYRTWDELSGLAFVIFLLYEAARRDLLTRIEPLPMRDLEFLHRLYASQDICGADRLTRLRREIGLRRVLYLLYRRSQSRALALLKGLARAWDTRDWRPCAALAHDAAVASFQAYTHLLGNTHHHPVGMLPHARASAVPEDLISRLIRIMVDREPCSEADGRTYVASCLDLIDDLLAAGAAPMRRISGYASRREARIALESQVAAHPCPRPMWEMAYRRKAFGLTAGSLRGCLSDARGNSD